MRKIETCVCILHRYKSHHALQVWLHASIKWLVKHCWTCHKTTPHSNNSHHCSIPRCFRFEKLCAELSHLLPELQWLPKHQRLEDNKHVWYHHTTIVIHKWHKCQSESSWRVNIFCFWILDNLGFQIPVTSNTAICKVKFHIQCQHSSQYNNALTR